MRKVKVLQFICPTGFYGAERWILTLLKNLDQNQIKSALAVTVEPEQGQLEIVDQHKRIGIDVFELPMSGRFDYKVIGRLCQLIRKEQFDIIHTHGYKSDILGLIAAKLTGIKSIATPHGFENASDWKLQAYIYVGNQFLKRFDRVVPLSQQLCVDVEEIGVKNSRVVYIQNGVDLDEVEVQRNREVDSSLKGKDVKRIGFIGQMISRKNIDDILNIFDSLAGEYSNIELKLLGDGEERARLETMASGLSSANKIEFLGFRDDRLEWLQTFDLFVMTSTLEGIPRCLMETMAMGVPVAAYNISGIDQLVKHDDTGYLAPLEDSVQLKTCWETLLFDKGVAARVSQSARQFVLEEYSGSRMAKEYTELFVSLME